MTLVELPPDVVRVGKPIPFALRDESGAMVVPRGTVVTTEKELSQITSRALYVDEVDADAMNNAVADTPDSPAQQNPPKASIAAAPPALQGIITAAKPASRRLSDPVNAWLNLHLRTSAVLRDHSQPHFESRTLQLQASLLELLDSDPDIALLLLVTGSINDLHDYSVRHALLTTVICELAARHVPSWAPEWQPSLRCAALTMNVAMTQLQNQLAMRDLPLSALQRTQIEQHPLAGAACMRDAGVKDELWLDAVERHHDSPPGPMANLPAAQQLARLIHRADIFAARMSARKRRPAMSANAAAKAAYFDENQQPDEAGSAIIKATGLYPPGSLVRLRSGEVAVVLRRGLRSTEPVVATIVNASGTVLATPSLRETRLPAFGVTGGAAPHEVKVRLDLERLVRLVRMTDG